MIGRGSGPNTTATERRRVLSLELRNMPRFGFLEL